MLVDAYGRPATDLRISVTERCNFKCFYCHNEGQGSRVAPPSAPHAHEMTPDEVERIVRAAASVGIDRVKLTGGEPLVRGDLEEIVRRCAVHVEEVSLTTNGSMLEARAGLLAAAGLDRVNVSLDSLTPREFEEIRGGQLAPVLRGVEAAVRAGLTPVKLNLVVYRQTLKNIDDLVAYAAAHEGVRIQLIQFMPEMAWMRPYTVDIEAVRGLLEARADAVAERRLHHRKRYRVGGVWVEVVDPVDNAAFCMGCQRLRVTSDGHVKGCINVNEGNLATRGLDEDGVRDVLRRAVAAREPFYKAPGVTPAPRPHPSTRPQVDAVSNVNP